MQFLFILGNLLRDGRVMYRDFFDHKGPILFIINAIGLSLSGGNKAGVWAIEVIFMFLNLLLLYKISKLFSKNKIINFLSTIISILPIYLFLENGNFAEEFALPFITYALYIFIKYVKNGKVKNFEIFLNGLCLGIVLLLRPNMIPIWIVYIPFIIYKNIKEKSYKDLIKIILIFLARNGSYYFTYNNIFCYK